MDTVFIHNGVKFRTELDARWSIFLDELGIYWHYEQVSFEFENGLHYLPDFWLPMVQMWAEVSPTGLTKYHARKANMLARATGYPVLRFTGLPDYREYNTDDSDNRDCGYVIGNVHDYYYDERRFFACGCWDSPEDFKHEVYNYEAAINAARNAIVNVPERSAR